MKAKRSFLSGICLLLVAFFLISAAACSFHKQPSEPSDSGSGDASFSGNNSDYVGNIGYEEGRSEDADFESLYEQTYRSVVTVSVSQSGGQPQTGTGFIVDSEDGIVVTSSSLFMDSAGEPEEQACSVSLYNGADISADLKGYDSLFRIGGNSVFEFSGDMSFGGYPSSANSDIAIVQMQNVENGVYSSAGEEVTVPAAVEFSDSDALVYGEECFSVATLAHEEDILSGLMSEGIITKPFNTHSSSFYFVETSFGQRREIVPFFDGSINYLIQTGIPVNEGNDGAPLFNAEGRLIGMVNMRVNDTYSYSENAPFGITFATPSETLYEVLTEAGVAISYEQQAVNRESCIVNADNLRPANDSVANMLMEESSDYLVVDDSETVVFRKMGEELSAGTTAQRVAENNLDRTVKVIAYSAKEQILSEGSGILIDKNGYIMTNLHVINALAEKNQEESGLANSSVEIEGTSVYCLFERGVVPSKAQFVVMPMDIIAYHQQGDLAILKFRNPIYHETNAAGEASTREKGFEKACVFETAVPEAGESVAALGNALGYGVSVSAGIVSIPEFTSYFSIYGYNMIQTDCPINSGNSGGALFNAEGKVIGINTLGFGGEGYDNISWAIPAAFAVQFVDAVNQGASSNNVHITEEGEDAQISLEQ